MENITKKNEPETLREFIERWVGEAYEIGHAHGSNPYKGPPSRQRTNHGWGRCSRNIYKRVKKEMREVQNSPCSAAHNGPRESQALCKCGKNPPDSRHSCPYAEEINDNKDPEYCSCCADCRQDCLDGI